MGMLEDALREYATYADRSTNPATPAAGHALVYVKDGKIHSIDDAGAVTEYGAGGSGDFAGARAFNSTDITLTTAVVTALALNSERFDSDAFHDTVTNNTRMTIPAGLGGVYLITGNVRFASNATGNRYIHIRLNGSDLIASSHRGGHAAAQDMEVSTIYELAETDYVELMAFQSSGGNLNVTALPNFSPEFMLAKL